MYGPLPSLFWRNYYLTYPYLGDYINPEYNICVIETLYLPLINRSMYYLYKTIALLSPYRNSLQCKCIICSFESMQQID